MQRWHATLLTLTWCLNVHGMAAYFGAKRFRAQPQMYPTIYVKITRIREVTEASDRPKLEIREKLGVVPLAC